MALKNTDRTGFSWMRGDSLPINLEFLEDITNNPIDITGWTIYYTLKKNKRDLDEDALISKTITEFTDPENGVTTFVISDTETDGLLGLYYWDVQLKTVDGLVYTVIKGSITFKSDITRRTT